MASRPSQPMRPSRFLAALALIFAIIYAIVFFGGSGSIGHKIKPKLGLDLVGGTTVTLIAKTPNGAPPKAGELETARQIIANRVNGLGVAEPEVVTEGNTNIVISVAGQNNDALKNVGDTAELRFRKVLNVTQGTYAAPAATPSASSSTTPSPSSSASPKSSASATPSSSPSAAASPTATPSPSTSAPAVAPPTTAGNSTPVTLADVQNKLGSAYAIAQGLSSPSSAAGLDAALQPFTTLTSDEVAVLPPAIQFNVPQVTCEKLNARVAGSIVNPANPAVACQGTSQKYLLDKATVLGTDIGKADAVIDSQSAQWVVNLTFKSGGVDKWTKLTTEAFNNTGSACQSGALGQNGHCLVAVVLDNAVVSAPEIEGVLTTTSTISGSFNQQSATLLADQLKYGALPLTFTQGQAQTISATLGTSQLKAGLIAMGLGMILVVAYAFFYYRLLGSVIMLSLVLSGLLTYGMLVLLGRGIGFTLTLAGMAGFIVSLGVAADSFVIYFERLKDEIRDGRTPRSAVPRAWVRARRTIITANVVSILAATTLYIFGVGSVKGFAFALGLATLLDLVVVFLFRHPMMTLLASRKAFLSPRVSGLGRVLQHASTEEPPAHTTRPKEA